MTAEPQSPRRAPERAPRPRRRSIAAILAWLSLAAVAAAIALAAAVLTIAPERVPPQWNPLTPLDLTAPDGLAQRVKILFARRDVERCRAALIRAGAKARARVDERESEHCTRLDQVSMRSLSAAALPTLQTRCPMALSLYLWESRVVQPAAERLLGAPVAEIRHLGSYACRKIGGRQYWSQHATSNAVDITEFRLGDGRRVNVENDWSEGEAAERAFLRAAFRGGCDHFTAVLGPDYNAAHFNHFHMDLGRWRICR